MTLPGGNRRRSDRSMGHAWVKDRAHERVLDGLHSALDAADQLDPLDDPQGLMRVHAGLAQARNALAVLIALRTGKRQDGFRSSVRFLRGPRAT